MSILLMKLAITSYFVTTLSQATAKGSTSETTAGAFPNGLPVAADAGADAASEEVEVEVPSTESGVALRCGGRRQGFKYKVRRRIGSDNMTAAGCMTSHQLFQPSEELCWGFGYLITGVSFNVSLGSVILANSVIPRDFTMNGCVSVYPLPYGNSICLAWGKPSWSQAGFKVCLDADMDFSGTLRRSSLHCPCLGRCDHEVPPSTPTSEPDTYIRWLPNNKPKDFFWIENNPYGPYGQ